MGESRQELLSWLNDLLQLNYTKVEQCGTGAALCQVFDSIYLDLPMQKVKFNVNTEYAYLQNFKILTTAFASHRIDRPIPVEKLVKCKMQDNLEFLQWMKKHWDQFYPGGEYDAVARRKGQSSAPINPSAGRAPASRPRGATTAVVPGPGRTRTPLGGGASNTALVHEIGTLKESVAGLERERDFYFSKLRDIELLLQETVEDTGEEPEDGLTKKIRDILYSTEEGFEIPDDSAEGGAQQDDETF